MEIVIEPGGTAHCIYSETIGLAKLGRLTIKRGSHVEPDAEGRWVADLSPVNGPRLGPFDQSKPGPRRRSGVARQTLAAKTGDQLAEIINQ